MWFQGVAGTLDDEEVAEHLLCGQQRGSVRDLSRPLEFL